MTVVQKGRLFNGRMWLLGGAGALVSYGLDDGSRRVEIATDVLDLVEDDGVLWVLRTIKSSAGKEIVVASRWDGAAFVDSPAVPGEGDAAFGMTVDDEGPIVLLHLPTWRQEKGPAWGLARLHGRSWRMTTWGDWSTPSLGTVTLRVIGGSVFVGFDAGEFPGGLYRVELATGAPTQVLPHDVTAMIDDPANPGCLLVAFGLVHLFSSEGGIHRVCGDSHEEVFSAPLSAEGPRGPIRMSEAVYGLEPTADGGYVAVTPEAVYRFADGKHERLSLAFGEYVNGIYITRLGPSLMAVWTARSHAAMNGAAPLLVAG